MIDGGNIKIKVCGMRDSANIMEVARLRPDYMGFIFYKKSPRYVGELFTVPAGFPSGIKSVGVFVNEDPTTILKECDRHDLGAVQLHGVETPETCRLLKDAGLEVIKVFSIGDVADFSAMKSYADCADYFLFDTKGKEYGGTGKSFDWQLLHDRGLRKDFFLSGGLNNENIDKVWELFDRENVPLVAVDVNSGVETSPGLKNIEKLERFIRSVRNRKILKGPTT